MDSPTTEQIKAAWSRDRPLTHYEAILLDRLEAAEQKNIDLLDKGIVVFEKLVKAEQKLLDEKAINSTMTESLKTTLEKLTKAHAKTISIYSRYRGWVRRTLKAEQKLREAKDYIGMLRNLHGCGDGCIGCEWCMQPDCLNSSNAEQEQ